MKRLTVFIVLLSVLASCQAVESFAINPYEGIIPTRTYTESPLITSTPTDHVVIVPTIIIVTPDVSCTVSTGVPSGYLNLRDGPGIDYQIITVLDEGDKLALTGRISPGWVEAFYQERTGWMNSNYCEKE